MVECEFYPIRGAEFYEARFNRYMVECELKCQENRAVPALVLIDTWWNVNSEFTSWEGWHKKVLIDTWWNVNYLSLHTVCPTRIRFNRYMVECEFRNINSINPPV